MKLGSWNSYLWAVLLVMWANGMAGATASAQPHDHHHAPWDSQVAWSQTIHAGGASIRVDVAPGPMDLSREKIIDWIQTAARAVSEYYGRFPVRRARVLVVPVADRRGVLTGTTWGGVDGYPAFTRMRVGEHTAEQDVVDDWTMTHEMVHTALPSLSRDHHWLEEGLATYVEPIARAQIGTLTPEFVWQETVKGMPKGEPQPGETGMDQTHTWANTYWGGALFCMMADIKIREATGNRKGLQEALRGIVAAGGSIAVEWPIAKVISTGDEASGTTVLADLYRQMGNQAFAPIDLEALWKQLGIEAGSGGVEFSSQAPLAAIRKAILAPEPAPDE
ncbi:MAG TPA: hypothetical protein VGR47_19280 [Terracidiphilus sp.]|nr:hypothetical protein [Terracidiphilus sp.]